MQANLLNKQQGNSNSIAKFNHNLLATSNLHVHIELKFVDEQTIKVAVSQ